MNRFLEGNQHAWLAKLRRPTHEEFHGEHRLATPRAAGDKRGPPRGEPAAGYFIESLQYRFGLLRASGGFRSIFFSLGAIGWIERVALAAHVLGNPSREIEQPAATTGNLKFRHIGVRSPKQSLVC